MEPVSLGVGIAGAISASISIGTALKKVTHQYRDAPESYTFTIKQCSAVSGQLALLQSLMLNETWSKQLGSDGDTSDYFVTIVMNCAENLQELEACVGTIRLGLLDAGGRGLTVKQKAKVVWKDDDIKTYLARLSTSKDDIGRVLAILQAESMARMETQMAQLRTSMESLKRSSTTKYRAVRVHGAGIDTKDSSVVVVPSTYPGAPQKVAGSGVSLADIDLTSVVLLTAADEAPGTTHRAHVGHASIPKKAESIRSHMPTGMFGGQMKAFVDMIEQDRVGMQQKLDSAFRALETEKARVRQLESTKTDAEALQRTVREKEQLKEQIERMNQEQQRSRRDFEVARVEMEEKLKKLSHDDGIELKKAHKETHKHHLMLEKSQEEVRAFKLELSEMSDKHKAAVAECYGLQNTLQVKETELIAAYQTKLQLEKEKQDKLNQVKDAKAKLQMAKEEFQSRLHTIRLGHDSDIKSRQEELEHLEEQHQRATNDLMKKKFESEAVNVNLSRQVMDLEKRLGKTQIAHKEAESTRQELEAQLNLERIKYEELKQQNKAFDNAIYMADMENKDIIAEAKEDKSVLMAKNVKLRTTLEGAMEALMTAQEHRKDLQIAFSKSQKGLDALLSHMEEVHSSNTNISRSVLKSSEMSSAEIDKIDRIMKVMNEMDAADVVDNPKISARRLSPIVPKRQQTPDDISKNRLVAVPTPPPTPDVNRRGAGFNFLRNSKSR